MYSILYIYNLQCAVLTTYMLSDVLRYWLEYTVRYCTHSDIRLRVLGCWLPAGPYSAGCILITDLLLEVLGYCTG